METTTMKWAVENVDKINLIDVRTPAEFENGNVKGSKNISLTELLMNHEQYLNKKDAFYIMCYSGGRSAHAIIELEKEGYHNLINVEGGFSTL